LIDQKGYYLLIEYGALIPFIVRLYINIEK
jgi:hypothetical protein